MNDEKTLVVERLLYRVHDKVLLNTPGFVIPKYKMTGIIGPNGSGKTTLLKHIYKELPTKGKIYVEGNEINSYEPKSLAKTIAVVNQHSFDADLRLSVEDTVLMARYPYKKRFEGYDALDRTVMLESLTKLGLREYVERSLGSLSGGEWQRVFIAKGFAQQTSYLILDEPTNHLDIKYKLELMRELKSFEGTVLLTLHDLQLAARFCDYIIMMKGGQIVHFGLPQEVMTAENLQTTFEAEFKVRQEDGYLSIHY